MREARLKNKRVRDKKDNKGAAEYFGANLAHLLNLVQVKDSKDLPPVWEALTQATNQQQLLVLQRSFDTAAEDMGLRALTIATPYLMKLLLALGFRMESREDLTTGLHPTVRKFLSGQADQYGMVASGVGALSLEDFEILSAPDRVTLT